MPEWMRKYLEDKEKKAEEGAIFLDEEKLEKHQELTSRPDLKTRLYLMSEHRDQLQSKPIPLKIAEIIAPEQ